MIDNKNVRTRTFGWQCGEFLRHSIAYYSTTGFGRVAALYADLLSRCNKSIEELQWLLDHPLHAAMQMVKATDIAVEKNRICELRKCVIHEVYRRFKMDAWFGDYTSALLYWAKNGVTMTRFLANQGDHHERIHETVDFVCGVDVRPSAFASVHRGLDHEKQSTHHQGRSLESAVSRLQQRFH